MLSTDPRNVRRRARRQADPAFVDTERAKAREWRSKNPTAAREHSRKWRNANRSKIKGYGRMYKYSLTQDDYEMMLVRQDGRCAVCGTTEPGKKGWCADHCHDTGKSRELLCMGCNTGTKLTDNAGLLLKKAAYLQKWERIHGA